MFENLEKYTDRGEFIFNRDEKLVKACNAPRNKGGIYLVYSLINDKENLIYIGSSGKIKSDGSLKIRVGGMSDRIVNGKQCEVPRRNYWPKKMKEEEIESIKVKWFTTLNEELKDIPANIEGNLIQEYYNEFICLPSWNKEY